MELIKLTLDNNNFQNGGDTTIPIKIPLLPNNPFQKTWLQRIENSLGEDYGAEKKVSNFIDEKIPSKYLQSNYEDDEVDAVRHAGAAMYLADTGKGIGAAYRAIPAFIQTNLSGLGHEIVNWDNTSSWMDLKNNLKGSLVGINPFLTTEEKEQQLLKMLEQRKLDVIKSTQPEIFYNDKTKKLDVKKQDGGKIYEGGYDTKRAMELGYMPNETGHFPTRDYETGQYLKLKNHLTTPLSVINDELIGYKVRTDINGNLFSLPRNQQYPDFDPNNPPKRTFFQQGGIIDDNMGQLKYPGKITRINSPNITMQGIGYPVLGVDSAGNRQMMQPNQNYTFDFPPVTEYPLTAGRPFVNRTEEIPQVKDGGKLIPLTL